MNRNRMRLCAGLLLLAACANAGEPAAAVPAEAAAGAKAIVHASGLKAGLCVCLGAGDGTLAAALAQDGKFLVHALDPDAGAVEKTRARIEKTGLYGARVSVERGAFKPLPYASNLVNLVVADGAAAGLDLAEVFRVIAPGGAVFVKGGEKGKLEAAGFKDVQPAAGGLVARKPRPADLDEWTHWRYDASSNPVSNDARVGPPEHVQWICHPRFGGWSGHKPVMLGLSAGGRLFYTHDQMSPFFVKPTFLPKTMREKRLLVARDAFSGVLLWKREIPFPGLGGVVVSGDRVFTCVALRGPIVALDAATGEITRSYEGTEGTRAIRHAGGVLLLKSERTLQAVDAAGGKKLWTHPLTDKHDACLAGESRVFHHSRKGGYIVAFDLRTGRELWRRADAAWLKSAGLSTCSAGAVFFVEGKYDGTVHALSAKDGADLWRGKFSNGNGYFPVQQVFLRGGLVYATTRDREGDKKRWGWTIFDAATGEKKGFVQGGGSAGGGTCIVYTGTQDYFMKGGTVAGLAPEVGVKLYRSMRTSCKTGTVPANGLLYYFAHDCGCGSSLRGTFALAPRDGEAPVAKPAERFERGPAAPGGGAAGPGDWPAFLHDPAHSGTTAASVPADLGVLWSAKVGSEPTAPVVAGGLVCVGSSDHRVRAFDAATGEAKWSFTTGGPVASAPTLHEGLCLAGSGDGWVYALNMKTGALVWRLHAAPELRKIVAFEQIASAWPVRAGVLVRGGVAYTLAGWVQHCDGAHVLAFEPRTGKILWERKATEVIGASLLFSGEKSLYCDGALTKGASWRPVRIDPKDGQMVALRAKDIQERVLTAGPHREIHHRFSKWRLGKIIAERIAFTPEAAYAAAWPGYKKTQGALSASGKASWSVTLPPGMRVNALILAGKTLVLAAPTEKGGEVWTVSAADGKKLGALALDAPPVPNSLAADGGRAYLTTADGRLHCLGKR